MLTDKKQPPFCNPEIWGGIECTINRVGDQYFDQLEYSGHYERHNDLDALADLGISKLRYPVLWEYHQKEKNISIDWSWGEGRLNRLRELNIDPVATLLHHGSGPSFTNLLDENFPFLLASYAEEVAKKFPWVTYYTPVNEPLTTARFSGLYGFWYPHKTNDVSFIKMLLNQLKGVVLSMRAIRKINPEAKLVQTEDLGKTYSTPQLEYQAIFENNRRWLTYDLLTGNVGQDHPMWQYFERLGIDYEEIQFFKDNPCPPDIMGMNYYVTSERYLDHKFHKYDSHTHGSNDLQFYADVEAVRVPHTHKTGLSVLLKEAWERYHIPLAITEAHLNCSREEQLRWLKEKWEDTCSLTSEGIHVCAFTVWSLFGAFGWNKLLITENKDYETGAFDIRSGIARTTAIADFTRSISKNNTYQHPVTAVPGWWNRNIRFLNTFGIRDKSLKQMNIDCPPILITGKTGTLGKAFARACAFRKINFVLLCRDELDITLPSKINQAINKYKPWAIINAAGYVKVDDAESDQERCYKENGFAVGYLAGECKKSGIQLMTFSSDLVFDGNANDPYTEQDQVNPLNIYGKSKALAEELSLSDNPDVLMIRTSAFFSSFDRYNFVYQIIDSLSSGKNFTCSNDIFISPTYVPDLVNTCLDLLIDKEKGLWHLSSGEKWSWAELASKVAEAAGLDRSLLNIVPSDHISFIAKRPKYAVLGTNKGIYLPSFEDWLQRYIQEDSNKIGQLQKKN